MNVCLKLILILFVITSNPVFALTPSRQNRIDTESYKFVIVNNNPYIKIPGLNQNIAIPAEWLLVNKNTPPIKPNTKVLLNHYEQKITAFAIDKQNQFVGLHLSSYVIHNSGSGSKSGIAYGKDVFLIYDRKTNELSQGKINLGISKNRAKTKGCFFAKFTHFYLQDLQRYDNYIDIGIQVEEIKCSTHKRGNKIVKGLPRYYNLKPIKWYKFNSKTLSWEYTDKLSPKTNADNIIEHRGIWSMPIICLVVTPIEYVKYIYKSRYSNLRKKDPACNYDYIGTPQIE